MIHVRELLPTSFAISDLRMGNEGGMQKIIAGTDGDQVRDASLPGTANGPQLIVDTSGQDHDRAVALMMEGSLEISVEAVTSEKVRPACTFPSGGWIPLADSCPG